MAALGEPVPFEAGDVVVEVGPRAPSVFLVERGDLEVVADDQPPVRLKTGDLFGEAGFLGETEPARVLARGETVVRRIEAVELATGLSGNPAVLHAALDAIRSVRRARVASEQVDPEAYVAALAAQSLAHRAVRHPYLTALAEGTLPDPFGALQDFARHYYGYSRLFLRYLTTVMAKLDDRSHRAALLENLTEESGQYDEAEIAELTALGIDRGWYEGVAHPELFARFTRAVGVEPSSDNEADQVVCWREMFLGVLANGSPAEALGALGLGTENIVSTIYQPLVKAAELAGLHGRDSVFFVLHTAVDDEHKEVLQAVAATYATTPEGRRDLRRGMIKALQARSAFWDWLHERALGQAPTRGELDGLQSLVAVARAREPLGEQTAASEGFVRSTRGEIPEMYRNQHERLGIDFSVRRLDFEDLQTMDPRIVEIAPSKTNELHRHAHESLFVVLQGEGEVRVGEEWQPLRPGDVAFVPRWIFHQTRNPSSDTPLVLLAITDYGFTRAALGDYDKRTRLANGGDQAAESNGSTLDLSEEKPSGHWLNRVFGA